MFSWLSPDDRHREISKNGWLFALAVMLLVGLGAQLSFAFSKWFYSAGMFKNFLETAAACLFLSGASLAMGALTGFLFGVPRLLRDPESSAAQVLDDNKKNNSVRINYQANTNLEQISDWLTKILVGVGLTQISYIPGFLHKLGSYFSNFVGGGPGASALAISIVLYYLVTGFLGSYFWTRLYLAMALVDLDRQLQESTREELENLKLRVEKKEKQPELDAQALSYVLNYLRLDEGHAIDVGQMKEAICKASANIKVQIFYEARRCRSRNWREHGKKYIVKRTIPIFEGLIAADTENRFHQNHGQLGYALKDQPKPDWAEAEKELTKAIDMRGPVESAGFALYEFNRAVCRIALGEDYLRRFPTPEEAKQTIVADLLVAKKASIDLKENEKIKRWVEQNNFEI
jgi:hypothetical protein